MDVRKMDQYAEELTEEIAELIKNKPRCREVLAGTIAATSRLLVLAATRVTRDVDQSSELIAIAVAAAYKLIHNAETEIKKGGGSE